MKKDLKNLKSKTKEEKLRKQFLNPKESDRMYLSPDEEDDTKEKRRVRRLNRMLRESKDNQEFDE